MGFFFSLCWKPFLHWAKNSPAMHGGEFDYGVKGVVEEEQKPAGDELIVDYYDYLHQIFDEMPVPVRQFSFVKVLPLENPEVYAMIKKAEETIGKMNQDQVLLAQKIRKRVVCEKKP